MATRNSPLLAVANMPNNRPIIAIDVYSTHLILHTSDGRHIRQGIPKDGASIYYTNAYASLQVSPLPFKEKV